ncbi:MAG: TIGR00282 family metallophosphoesterase [Spirochaetales bacterium]|nr:TIGR00282 family metallophosphoesterase [Spirochaetales bacterium]
MLDSSSIRVLMLGDVIGHPGMRALFSSLKILKKEYKSDFVIVNAENAADGYGLLPHQVDELFNYGVDAITSGNHIWQKEELYPFLDREDKLLRPSNYPKGVPGHGDCILESKGVKLAVLNLQGRVRMSVNCECPFVNGLKDIKRLKSLAKCIVVDFHAEDVTEKEALACYFDGKVSAVVGTHTHIQTADEKILANGTAYISDIGMTGPINGVIGSEPEAAIKRVFTSIPYKTQVLDEDAVINGVVIEIDTSNGHALSIERVTYKTGL